MGRKFGWTIMNRNNWDEKWVMPSYAGKTLEKALWKNLEKIYYEVKSRKIKSDLVLEKIVQYEN